LRRWSGLTELDIAVKETQVVQHNSHFGLYTWLVGFSDPEQ